MNEYLSKHGTLFESDLIRAQSALGKTRPKAADFLVKQENLDFFWILIATSSLLTAWTKVRKCIFLAKVFLTLT